MKNLIKYMLLSVWCLLSLAGNGQSGPEKAGRLENNKFILKIDLKWSEEQKEKLAMLFELDSIVIAKIFEKDFTYINDSTEWNAAMIQQGLVELSKDLGKPSDTWPQDIILSDVTSASKIPSPMPVPAPAAFGVNEFAEDNIFEYRNGKACFTLKGYKDARKVYLSGSFNQWSTMQLPMEKTDSGWKACIALPPGKHLYKYIVDGRWMPDPNNKRRESDGNRGQNSIVFCYNHIFSLDGSADARRVIVAGSFNGWNTRQLRMEKTDTGWELPMYLREGTHAYKFIVDGNWITDPENPVTRPDGAGNLNSFIGIGDTIFFKLRKYPDAKQVILTGNFNEWNHGELLMERVDDTWILPYVLAAGNYEYKFIVDGKWILDPVNPFTVGSGDFINSFLAFKPNHLFELKAFPDANLVIITGSFNGWSHNDYRMVYRDGEWVFPIRLQPGRHSYKYIVDGEWILDPTNPLWEDNEFGSGNSVLWVE